MYTEHEYLAHSGVKGMKWGIRRYRNEDGSLTEAGKKRYSKTSELYNNRLESSKKAFAKNTFLSMAHGRDLETRADIYGGLDTRQAYISSSKRNRIDWRSRKAERLSKNYQKLMAKKQKIFRKKLINCLRRLLRIKPL